MFHLIVLLATLAVPPTSLSAAPLRTTKEVRALSLGEMRRGLPVEISGQIIAELYPGGLIIADETGGYDLEVVPAPVQKSEISSLQKERPSLTRTICRARSDLAS